MFLRILGSIPMINILFHINLTTTELKLELGLICMLTTIPPPFNLCPWPSNYDIWQWMAIYSNCIEWCMYCISIVIMKSKQNCHMHVWCMKCILSTFDLCHEGRAMLAKIMLTVHAFITAINLLDIWWY